MISAKILRKAIQSTSFAIASLPAYSEIAGVRFEVEPNCLRAIATDGYRLAIFEAPCSVDAKAMEFSIGRQYLRRLEDFLCNAGDAPVVIQAADDTVAIEANGKAFCLSPMGRFLNWRSAAQMDKNHTQVRFDRTAFQNALAQVRRQTTRQDRRIAAWFLQDRVVLFAIAPEKPGATVVSAQSTDSDYAIINADFLRDALKTFPVGEVELRFKSGGKGVATPIEINSTKSGNWLVRHLIMPCYPAISPLPPIH